MAKKIRRKQDTVPRGSNVEECVSNQIPHLMETHPEYSREQAIAVAYSKCRKKFGQDSFNDGYVKSISGDSLMLKNQMVAQAGTLPYLNEDGEIEYRLKRPEDLMMNRGRIVPLLDEHPPVNNGNFGLYSGKEEIMGYGFLKEKDNGDLLISDMLFFDKSKERKGYSIGYALVPIETPGVWRGQKYDSIQGYLVVDHIALTDNPRNENAVKIISVDGGIPYEPLSISVSNQYDSISNQYVSGMDSVFITAVGYDSYEFDAKASSGVTLQDIIARLSLDSPESSEEEIKKHAETIFRNIQEGDKMPKIADLDENSSKNPEEMDEEEEEEEEEEMDEKEEEEEGKAFTDSSSEIDSLKAQNKALMEKIKALDAKEALQAEIDAKEAILAEKDAKIRALEQDQKNSMLSRLKIEFGCDNKEDMKVLADASADFLKGALWMGDGLVRSPPQAGTPVDSDALGSGEYSKSKTRNSGDRKLNQYNRRWDFEQGKYVHQDEWSGR